MSDAFYVGYLATPPATARRLKRIAVALVVLAAVVATALAIATGPFDRATYEFGKERTWQGKIEAAPVPVLIAATRPGAGSPFETLERFPLVAQGKHSADAMIAGSTGCGALQSGTHRARSTTMLEVVPGTSTVQLSLPADGNPPPSRSDRRATFLRRDRRCQVFLGRHEPRAPRNGTGVRHRCIAGSIPMLFVRDAQGREGPSPPRGREWANRQ
jgi:hypothetical protein